MNSNACLEVSRDDLSLLSALLSQELEETKIEVHHSRSYEYKKDLMDREQQIRNLLMRIEETSAVSVR